MAVTPALAMTSHAAMLLTINPTRDPGLGHDSSPSVALGGALARWARAGHAPGIFFDPCPTGDPLGGALSAVRAQCNYLDVSPS